MFLIWTAIGALTSGRHYFLTPARPETVDLVQFVGCIVWSYPWIALTPLVFRLEARFPLGGRRWARNLAWLALFSVPISLLAAPLMQGFFLAVLAVLQAQVRMPRGAGPLVGRVSRSRKPTSGSAWREATSSEP